MAKTIITLGVGGAGSRLALAFMDEVYASLSGPPTAADSPLFAVSTSGGILPRLILVDTDGRAGKAMADVATSGGRPFQVSSMYMTHGKDSASRSFGRAYQAHVDTRLAIVLDRVQRLIDKHPIDGFLVFHSLAGGTGSGLGAKLVEQLAAHHAKKSIVTVSLLPSVEAQGSPLDPINAALALARIRAKASMCLLADNDALIARCNSSDPGRLDRELARSVGSLGVLLQERTVDLASLQQQLVSAPMMPYVMVSRAVSKSTSMTGFADRIYSEDGALASYPKAALAKPITGAMLVFRGGAKANEVSPVQAAVQKRVVAGGGGLRSHIVSNNQAGFARALHAFSSHAGIGDLLNSRVLTPFENLRKHDALLAGVRDDGIEEAELTRAKTRLIESIKAYKTVGA